MKNWYWLCKCPKKHLKSESYCSGCLALRKEGKKVFVNRILKPKRDRVRVPIHEQIKRYFNVHKACSSRGCKWVDDPRARGVYVKGRYLCPAHADKL